MGLDADRREERARMREYAGGCTRLGALHHHGRTSTEGGPDVRQSTDALLRRGERERRRMPRASEQIAIELRHPRQKGGVCGRAMTEARVPHGEHRCRVDDLWDPLRVFRISLEHAMEALRKRVRRDDTALAETSEKLRTAPL